MQKSTDEILPSKYSKESFCMIETSITFHSLDACFALVLATPAYVHRQKTYPTQGDVLYITIIQTATLLQILTRAPQASCASVQVALRPYLLFVDHLRGFLCWLDKPESVFEAQVSVLYATSPNKKDQNLDELSRKG